MSESKPPKRREWSRAVMTLVIALLVFLSVYFIRGRGWLQPLELLVYDVLLRNRPEDPSTASEIVIIGIDEEDLRSRVVGSPFTDAQMAGMLERLVEYEASGIGIDIYRDLPPAEGAAGRERLVRLWKENDFIILPYLYDVAAPPEGVSALQAGFVDFIEDPDGLVRRGLLAFQPPGEEPKFSLALQLAAAHLYAEEPPTIHDDHAHVGKGRLEFFTGRDWPYVNADARGKQVLLDFRTPRDRIRRFSARDLLQGQVTREDIAGKAVLIGWYTPTVKDYLATPEAPRRFGVEVHAEVLDQLLRTASGRNTVIRLLPAWQETGLVLLFAVAGSLLGYKVRTPAPFVIAALGTAAVWGAIVFFAFLRGWWLPFLPPAMTWTLAAFVVTAYISHRERADRLAVMELFSRHVSADVAQKIWAERELILGGGKIKPVRLPCATALFLDLEGFSALAERVDPETLLTWLNELMDRFSESVRTHDGYINKYMGDALMAVFGAPLPRQEEAEFDRDAQNAVRCALDMREKLCGVLKEWSDRGFDAIRMRIGIYTGPVIAGSIGGADRLEYTVTGDTVNTASRLENYDKKLMGTDVCIDGTRILLGQPTLDRLGDTFTTRFVADAPLSRMRKIVAIHAVVS